jgi:2-oxoglutarate ferredoxin oxidoreductase subunit alpha
MPSNVSFREKQDISIVLCGQAGQGIQTVEFLLTRLLKLVGYNVFATKEYMSRVRGGMNSTTIRFSSRPVRALVDRIDILVALDRGAVAHVEKRISGDTVVLAEKQIIGEDFGRVRDNFADVPFVKTAADIGGKVYSNVVAVGVLAGVFGIDNRATADFVRKFFSAKAGDIVENNVKAASAGHKLGTGLASSDKVKFQIGTDADVKDQILLNGAEAVGMGAIAGGCNFIAAYPMSPSTGVLVFLA